MDTLAFSYNQARRELAEARELYPDKIYSAIASGVLAKEERGWAQVAITATAQVKARGSYPYLKDVARQTAVLLKEEPTPATLEILEQITYQTNCYMRAKETIELYERYWKDGYISIHDITEEHNGKIALLSGSADVDLFRIKKDNEKVKLIKNFTTLGYQKPRMRTRFYRPQIDANLFVKVV